MRSSLTEPERITIVAPEGATLNVKDEDLAIGGDEYVHRSASPRTAKRYLNACYESAKPLVMRSRPVHAPTPGAAHKLLVGVPGALGNQRGDFML
jgi:hypothetical protein